ncbi:MAG TPA: serine hydrolase domain-containing protein, partial [Polyangiaceae bacterium]
VARAAGTTYEEYLAAHVLRPLGMPSTGFEPPTARLATGYLRKGEGVEHPPMMHLGAFPAGGLFSSVRDMARYAEFELSAWPPRDDGDSGPLRRSSVREAQQMGAWMGLHVPRRGPGKSQVAIADGYGFGWVAEQTCEFDRIVWHNGALTDGYRSMLMLLPERGVGLVVLANLFDEHMDLEDAVREAAHLLDASGALAGRVVPPTSGEIEAREGVLSLRERWDDALAARLFPAGAAGFLVDLKKSFADDLRDHGSCTTRSTVADGPSHLKWEMTCDHGGESWEIKLDARGDRVDWIHGEDHFPPDPRLAKAAGALASLVARWDDRVYEAQLGAAKDEHGERAKVKAAFAAARDAQGSCNVNHPDDRGDKTHARFELACTRGGPLEMRATLDDKSGKVTSVTLGEPEHDEKRCP